jgi:formate dehydrogenase assembly factor FdhD
MIATLRGWQQIAADHPEAIYLVGQNTTRLPMSAGDLVVGYLLTCGAVTAHAAVADATGAELDVYTGKIAVARFCTASVLPNSPPAAPRGSAPTTP